MTKQIKITISVNEEHGKIFVNVGVPNVVRPEDWPWGSEPNKWSAEMDYILSLVCSQTSHKSEMDLTGKNPAQTVADLFNKYEDFEIIQR